MSFKVSNISCWMMFFVVWYLPSLRVGDLLCHLCHLMRMEDSQSEHHVWISPWNTETSEMRESNIRQWWTARIASKRKNSEPSLMWPKMSMKLAAQDHIQEILCGVWLDAQVRSNLLSNPRLSHLALYFYVLAVAWRLRTFAAHLDRKCVSMFEAQVSAREALLQLYELPPGTLEKNHYTVSVTTYFHIHLRRLNQQIHVKSFFGPKLGVFRILLEMLARLPTFISLSCSNLKSLKKGKWWLFILVLVFAEIRRYR